MRVKWSKSMIENDRNHDQKKYFYSKYLLTRRETKIAL